MAIEIISNRERGLSVRTKLNAAIREANKVEQKADLQALLDHVNNGNNPHNIIPESIGAEREGVAFELLLQHANSPGNVHGVPAGQLIEWKASAQAKADAALTSANTYTDQHEQRQDNPHGVTYTQVGADAEGTAAQAVTNHEAAHNPHDQYVRKDTEALKKSATLDLDFASGEYSQDDGEKVRTTNAGEVLTVERATPKWVFGPNGKLREVPPNTLARQWNPATGEPEGALIEESRTNLLARSEDFTQRWGSQDLTATSDVSEAPDGSVTANKLTEGTGTSFKYTRQGVGDWPDNTVMTFSLFVRASELTQIRVAIRDKSGSYRGADFDLVTEEPISTDSTIRSYSIKRVSNGWFRVSVTHDIGAHPDNTSALGIVYLEKDGTTVYTGDSTSGIYVWGAQLEEGTLSSYIPTTDSPVTRAADNVSRVLGEEFNPFEVTWTFEGRLISGDGDNGFNALHSLTDGGGSGSRTYTISWSADDSRIRALVYNADNEGLSSISITDASGRVSGDYIKVAASYSRSKGTLSMSINGSVIDTVNYAVTGRMSEINTQYICSGLRGLSEQGDTSSEVSTATVYPRALSETELQELTQ